MENRSRLNGTVLVSVLTLCCSTICCATGIYAVADQGQTIVLGPAAGVPMILLGVLVWIVPPLAWVTLMGDRKEGTDEG
jgi:hypothetical protein